MPPPPPPPPPMGGPAPPPPPPPAFGGGGGKSSGGGDRNALLSDIHKGGFKLKKTVTNDRSTPLVSNKPTPSNGSASSGPPSVGSSARSPNTTSAPQGLGGLFSNGIPKLKSTGSRFLPEQNTSSSSSPSPSSATKPSLNGSNTISGIRNQDIASSLNKRFASTPQKPEVPKSKSTWNNGSATVSKASNLSLSSQSSTLKSPSSNKSSPEFEQARSKLTNIFSNSNNNLNNNNSLEVSTPSPRIENSPTQFTNTNGSSLHRLNTSNKYHTIGPQRKSSTQATQREEMPAHKGQAPQPPGGGLVKRSNSQTNSSRPKPSGPKPPSVKPPPPPKHSSSLSVTSGQRGSAPAPPPPPAHQNNSGKPPAPPRGSSISDELSSHGQSSQNALSLARQQFFEPITSPTTPNPPTLPSGGNNKMGYNHSHSASQTSLNSSRPVRPPVGPPPPPPSRFSSVNTNNNNNNSEVHKPLKPAPPIPQQIEQLMADGGWTDPAPNPPQRGSSRSLATRFKFAPITSLPAPEQMLNPSKMFPSQAPKPRKQGAPPVPEMPMNGQANNFLHSAAHRPSPVSIHHHQDRRIHINIQRNK